VVGLCVCACVSGVMCVSRTKTAEPIEMPFGMLTMTHVGPRNRIIRYGRGVEIPHGKGYF